MNCSSVSELQPNILLSGASGFIGSHLRTIISNEKLAVIVHENRNIEHPNIYFRDIKSIKSNDKCFKGIDTVIHCAGIAHSNLSLKSQNEILDVNVTSTISFAESAINSGVKRFIFLSSLNVYGDSYQNKVIKHNDEPYPKDITGISKLYAENGLRKIAKKTGLQLVIIRAPLIYGEGVKGNFATLLNIIFTKLPLPLGAINTNKRSLVSVYNLVDLIKVCIEHPKAANQTFLVSDGDDLSTTAMIKLMAEVQCVKSLLIPLPVWSLKLLGKVTGKSDMISRLTDSLRVDITHTQETLNWTPPFSVKEGFAKCIENKDV